MQFPTHINRIDMKRALGISGALGISAFMIVGAYFFSGPNFFTAKTANAEDTKKLLEAYAAKDTDSDGLPDWQEALYDTNPQDPHSISPTLTDGQAVAQGLVKPKFESAPIATTTDLSSIPGIVASSSTLTDEFSKELFQQYIQTTGQTPATPEQITSFVTGAVGQLNTMYVAPVGYTLSDIKIAGTGTAAVNAYAASAENVFFSKVPAHPQDESLLFSNAVINNDPKALAQVAQIGALYTSIGKNLAKMSVPQEVASAHLRLANAFITIGSVVTDMAAVNTDPVRTLVAIGKYDAALQEVVDSYSDMNKVFAAQNISIEAGNAGYRFTQMVKNWSTLK